MYLIEFKICLNEFIQFCKDTSRKCYPDAVCEYHTAAQVWSWEWEWGYESSGNGSDLSWSALLTAFYLVPRHKTRSQTKIKQGP